MPTQCLPQSGCPIFLNIIFKGAHDQYEHISRQKYVMCDFKGRSIFRRSEYKKRIFQVQEIIYPEAKLLKHGLKFGG